MSDRKNFFYYLLPSIVSGTIGLGILPITTYFLEPADFGVYALLAAMVMPVSSFSSTGAVWVLGAHFFKVDETGRKKLLFNILFVDLVSKFFWLSLFWFLTPLVLKLAVAQYELTYTLFFRLVLISILLNAFGAAISAIFIYQRRARVHALVEIIGPIIGALTTIFCLGVLKLQTISLFIGPLAAEICSVSIALVFIWRYLMFNINKQLVKEVIKIGLPAMPLELLTLLNNIADRFFIQKWFNMSILGIYAHSLNYKSVFSLGLKSFSRIYCPHVLEKFSKNESIAELSALIKKWLGLVGLAGIFVTLFSYEIVNVLTHGKFVAAVPLIPLWYLIVVFATYGLTYLQYLLVHKKNVYMTISGAIITVFSIGMTALFIYKFGLIGAVVSALVSSLLIQFSLKWYAKKNGCPEVGNREFLLTTLGLLLIYAINMQFAPSLLIRAGMSAVLAAVIIYRYDLLKYLRSRKPAT